MDDFSHQIRREDIRSGFLGAIRGNHPFRRFKDKIADHNLWEEWNQFRRRAFEGILRDWCEENGIRPAKAIGSPSGLGQQWWITERELGGTRHEERLR
jgi:hypothetical protein